MGLVYQLCQVERRHHIAGATAADRSGKLDKGVDQIICNNRRGVRRVAQYDSVRRICGPRGRNRGRRPMPYAGHSQMITAAT